MATLSFKDFDLNQTTITGRRNTSVELDSFKAQYRLDKETNQRTEEKIGYVADIVARNRIQSVKLPLGAVDDATVTTITTALENGKVVKINFGATASTLRGRCYALINNRTGQLISGLSCTASELNVVSIEEPESDDFDEFNDVVV